MIQITNGKETLEVTKGAFEETYAALGYSEVSQSGGQSGQASNSESAGFTGNPEDGQNIKQDIQEQEQSTQAQAEAVEPKASRKAKTE